MLPNIEYSHSQRQYLVYNNGAVAAAFPCGIEGKRAAFQEGVRLHNPALYALATQVIGQAPALASRVWRACGLVLTGGVSPGFDQRVLASVRSSNEFGDYEITAAADGGLICNCPDYPVAPLMSDTQQACKHVLAYVFTVVVDQQHPY